MKQTSRMLVAVTALATTSSCNRDRPDDTPDAFAANETVTSGLGAELDHAVAQVPGFSGTVLVADGGQVVLAKGYGFAHRGSGRPNMSNTAFDTGSLSKAFTAIAILQLEGERRVRRTDRLDTWFPGLSADKAAITIDQLLTHSAGLPLYHGDGDFQTLSKHEALDEIFAADLRHPPGERYRYSNSGHTVLAAIVERASGLAWTDYLRRNVFARAGMRHSGFYGDPLWDEPGVAHGYVDGRDRGSPVSWDGPYWALIGNGGIVTTGFDLLRWHLALRAGKILTPVQLDALLEPRVRAGGYIPNRYDGMRAIADSVRVAYFGWWWRDARGTLNIEKGGSMDRGHNVLFRMLPEDDVLVVVLCNREDPDADVPMLRVPVMDALVASIRDHRRKAAE